MIIFDMKESISTLRTNQLEIKLRSIMNALGARERRLAEYLLSHYDHLPQKTIAEIATGSLVSEATVVRLCHKIGYSGLKELKILIAREQGSTTRSSPVNQNDDSELELLKKKVFLGSITALQDTMELLQDEQLELASKAICQANHITLYAIGGSVPVARHFKHQFMKLGVPCNVYNEFQPSIIAAEKYVAGDVAIAITHSGETPPIVAAMESAHSKGATTICITSYGASSITQCADIKFFTTSDTLLNSWDHSLSRIAQNSIVNLLYANVALHYNSYQDEISRR